MVENVLGNERNSLRRCKCFLAVNIPDLLIINVGIDIHCLDVINAERKNVLVVDGIHDGVCMKLISKCLLRSEELRIPYCPSICREDRRSRKAKHIIFFEVVNDSLMHITKLAAMAFIKDNNNLLIVNSMLLKLFDEGGQLLNRCNNDVRLRIT